jgi:8-amino-7-oxononanoate synthase
MRDPLAHPRDVRQARDPSMQRVLQPRNASGNEMLDLASNDYLGLSRDQRVIAAAAAAAHTWGVGSTGSRLVTGSTTLHADLEQALSAFTGAPAALVFSSGYLANLGAVVSLSGPGCLVVSDAGNHASIIDACRLSRAEVRVTPHRDVSAVAAALSRRESDRAVVVTDAVFSVDGDLAPLSELHEVARRHGALLIVDEAHALGVVGPGGAGAVAAAGLSGEPDVVRTVTLSKSLGSQGGAVLGAEMVVDHLVNVARAFIFDTALAMPSAAAALAAIEILKDDPLLPERVRTSAGNLAAVAARTGWDPSGPSAAVISLPAQSARAALSAVVACAERGVRVGCFRPPSVPDGISRVRLTARADLSPADISRAYDALFFARSAADSKG